MAISLIPDEQFVLTRKLTPFEIKDKYSSLKANRLQLFEILRLPDQQIEDTQGYDRYDVILANPTHIEIIELGGRELVFVYIADIFAKVEVGESLTLNESDLEIFDKGDDDND